MVSAQVPCRSYESSEYSQIDKTLRTCNIDGRKIKADNYTVKSRKPGADVKAVYLEERSDAKQLPHGLAEVFTNLEAIFFYNCSIEEIHYENLKGLSKLKYLDVEHNHIGYLMDGTFADVVNLVFLELSNNEITFLQENVFDPLTHLEKLHLENNRIKFLHPNLFHSLSNLHFLSFNNNLVQFLHPDLFNSLVHLEELDFAHNDISRLDEHLFHKLTNMKNFTLGNNTYQEIPEKLFEKNVLAENLHLISASIDFIHPQAFDNLPNLKNVALDETCADGDYDATQFAAMKEDIVKKCGDQKVKLDDGYKTLEKQVEVLMKMSNLVGHLPQEAFVSYR